MLTYIGVVLVSHPNYSGAGTSLHFLLESWDHWDANNYVNIAQRGYPTKNDFAFFPLYPFAIRIVAIVVRNYVVSGILLSNAAFLGALIVIHKLVLGVTGDTKVAQRTIVYLTFFPTAFFLFAAYNEAFFILFSAGMFLAMQHRQWLLAGILGALASGTRSVGILLVLPYLWECWSASDQKLFVLSKERFVRLLPICLIPIGLLVFCFYCWQKTGDPLAFSTVQAHWGRTTMWPWQAIWLTLYGIFQVHFGSFLQVHLLLDLSATLAFLLLTILGWRYLPKSYIIWSASILLLLLCNASISGDILQSNQRIVLESFPGFIVLGIISKKYPRLHQMLIFLFPFLLSILCLLFLERRWMV
ncbi:mannosyltransferase family protein [Dictyobacter arantiisoli]|uniref:mannosyltransferase family protein n=1 Tax=Dictyobacter arantiisoli TaxID=2014874 RepID=UPI001C0EBE60|nr:mannosyltransferase family protein [Dictyobacter arantiisoli]